MINSNESQIIGHWVFDGKKMTRDTNGVRINNLVNHYLIKIAVDGSGWITLYQDSITKDYWEHKFENSDMDGGGPAVLIKISAKEKNSKCHL